MFSGEEGTTAHQMVIIAHAPVLLIELQTGDPQYPARWLSTEPRWWQPGEEQLLGESG